jgi:hypothetical protein
MGYGPCHKPFICFPSFAFLSYSSSFAFVDYDHIKMAVGVYKWGDQLLIAYRITAVIGSYKKSLTA